MSLRGKAVIVTGGGRGLGEGLAQTFVGRGARVMIVDLDGEAVAAAAERHGVIGVQADLADRSEVLRVIETCEKAYGQVDVFCSNAATAGLGDFFEVDDAEWDLYWRVNVMSHIWAARNLIPKWVARGEGHLFQTVSVTALTLNHWDPAYAVSKRAALAFNEYVAVRFGPKGVGVTAFCPRGMRTRLLIDSDSRAAQNALRTAVTPLEAAELAVRGVEEKRFIVLTEGEEIESHRRRAADYDAWIAARQQQALEEVADLAKG